MFHEATKSLAKQLDPEGNLIPVRCLVDHNHFRVLCLVQRNSKNPWWRRHHYYKTDYKLSDVLLPGQHTAKLDICDSDSFTIVDHVDGKVEGDVCVATDLATLRLESRADLSHARSVKVKKRHISSQVLNCLDGSSKINLDHVLIKQSERFRKNLYVITETVEATEATEFRESKKTEGNVLAELRVKMKFAGLHDSKKAVIIPKDCTLAFRVKRLLIREGSLASAFFPEDTRGTFQSGKFKYQADGTRSSQVDYQGCRTRGSIQVGEFIHASKSYVPVVIQKVMGIEQMEIEEACTPLLSLSTDLRETFLHGFLAIIRNNDLLEELELQLEQALDETNPVKMETGRPELQELVDNLQDSTGAICQDIAEAVLYFLQALDELPRSEMLLLEESVERKIVPKQTALVQRILENCFSHEKGTLIDAQKVSSFIEDELDITEAMIKLSGVTVQRNGSSLAVTGNPDAFLALGSLYVALYVLSLLSK